MIIITIFWILVFPYQFGRDVLAPTGKGFSDGMVAHMFERGPIQDLGK
jgi:hypothetical protein